MYSNAQSANADTLGSELIIPPGSACGQFGGSDSDDPMPTFERPRQLESASSGVTAGALG